MIYYHAGTKLGLWGMSDRKMLTTEQLHPICSRCRMLSPTLTPMIQHRDGDHEYDPVAVTLCSLCSFLVPEPQGWRGASKKDVQGIWFAVNGLAAIEKMKSKPKAIDVDYSARYVQDESSDFDAHGQHDLQVSMGYPIQ